MSGAPSIVPAVGEGLCLPRVHPSPPGEGLNIAQAQGGVKTLRQAVPWLLRAGLKTSGRVQPLRVLVGIGTADARSQPHIL